MMMHLNRLHMAVKGSRDLADCFVIEIGNDPSRANREPSRENSLRAGSA
jgi:hypothetical protein